ncbi:MAG: NAD(P)/FAD-dependent oxidoreductase [Mycoplasmatales bacterium]
MNYLILGSSAAGVNAAKELRDLNQDANITIASKDKQLFSRCILHHLIEGKRDESQLHFLGPDVLNTHNINFLGDYVAKSIDTDSKTVSFENGEELTYDKLLIATGSSSFIPPVENLREAKQVIGLRDLEDAQRIKASIKDGMSVAVIGSGLVGMDVLEALTTYNVKIHLVDLAPRLLSLQLDDVTSQTYLDAAMKYDVTPHFNTLAKLVHVDSDNNVVALELDNGDKFDCDLIVCSAGTRSNIGFLEGSNIETWERGLKFDNFGRTNVEDVYGAGDVSGVHPIWPMAVKEGIVAASNMSGIEKEMKDHFAFRATMNFFGIPTMSVGLLKEEDGTEFKILNKDGVYRKIAIRDNKVVGAILQGDIGYGGILIQLIKKEYDISHLMNKIFDLDYSDFFNLKEDKQFDI